MQPTALMVMDMQRDFCDRDGVFARNGFSPEAIEKIIPAVARVMQVCKTSRIPIVATKLTVLEDMDGRGMGLGHLNELRPFLKTTGFREGSPGQQVIPQLPRPDYEVRKWGYSAMYLTELEKVLRSLQVKHLVFMGIATNGVVEGTARDAVAREFDITTLRDCVAGYNQELHEASLKNLANIGRVITSADFLAEIATAAEVGAAVG
jgi:ureidoacrylate peracid hydrolase